MCSLNVVALGVHQCENTCNVWRWRILACIVAEAVCLKLSITPIENDLARSRRMQGLMHIYVELRL